MAHSPLYAKALRFATAAHKGQERTSGEPFVTHVIAVADILKTTVQADDEMLVAALLHDVLEDTKVKASALEAEFGDVILHLVEGVTKVERIEQSFDKRERNMESIRKMFRAMDRDIRVLFIKIADRIHNMRTLGYVAREKQVRVARETQEIYVPLSNLLGVRLWYEELADLCFSILDPSEYDLTKRKYEQAKREQFGSLERWADNLRASLLQAGIGGVQVTLLPRHLREVRNATREQPALLRNIETFFTLRVTTKRREHCYTCLGELHAFASPDPGGTSDYIAAPKTNGYQALSTIVHTSSGAPTKVIIQTEEMAKRAEQGLAQLLEGKDGNRELPQWVEALLSLEEKEDDLHTFFYQMQKEIFTDHIHVQIVGGKERGIDLPADSTLVDLAFYVNRQTGAKMEGALVNGKYRNLGYVVQDGDSVEFLLSKMRLLRNAQDLYNIRTSLAHKHLIHELSSLKPEELLQRGHDLLNHAIDMTMDPFFSIYWQNVVHNHIHKSPAILRKIGCGILDPFIFIENSSTPQEFFLLHPSCFHVMSNFQGVSTMHYVLRASVAELRSGEIVGIQAGPDILNIVSTKDIRKNQFSHEIVPLKIRQEHLQYPFQFALRWTFTSDARPLDDIGKLQNLLDTPVNLLHFDSSSVTLGFLTDSLSTLHKGYKYLYSLPTVSQIFRITPS